ncbi:uncharacterized protein ISCGN_022684 [Ixodes scapularis]
MLKQNIKRTLSSRGAGRNDHTLTPLAEAVLAVIGSSSPNLLGIEGGIDTDESRDLPDDVIVTVDVTGIRIVIIIISDDVTSDVTDDVTGIRINIVIITGDVISDVTDDVPGIRIVIAIITDDVTGIRIVIVIITDDVISDVTDDVTDIRIVIAIIADDVISDVEGTDYKETFSPVVKLKSIGTLLAIAVERNWKIHQVDITAAYLDGTLKETVYMKQPQPFGDCKKDEVCLLKKSLYGLRRSGREWNLTLDKLLKWQGMTRLKADPCIYVSKEKKLIVGVYVDDLLIIAEEEKANLTQKTWGKLATSFPYD